MKTFNLSVYELKHIEHILDALMNRAPVGFLWILGAQ